VWTEVGVAGGAIVGLVGLVLRMQNSKIDKGMTKELCEERHGDTDRRLGRGVERFDKIDSKLDDQNAILIEVRTTVKALAKKNGVE